MDAGVMHIADAVNTSGPALQVLLDRGFEVASELRGARVVFLARRGSVEVEASSPQRLLAASVLVDYTPSEPDLYAKLMSRLSR